MRWLAFLYGLLAYLLGIRALVYFVLFASNVPWVKTVDSGPATPWPQAIAIDLALLLLFALTHSLMARDGFKRAYLRLAPESTSRSTYVLVAAVCLSLLMWQWRPLESTIWEIQQPAGRTLLLGLCGAGWLVAALAYYSIGHLYLLGISQAYHHFKGRSQPAERLVTTSVYRVWRNPMYLGFLIGIWSTPRMTAGHLLLAAGLTTYVLIGRRYEKRDLVARFGDRYLRYLG